jgi:predicted GIY-YIG superfamily endonuclease
MRREGRIKGWKHKWKIQLIGNDNPHWVNLYPDLSK